MAGKLGSAVVEVVANRFASTLNDYFHKLMGNTVPSNIERLEWKLLKIRSVIDESMKYDIKNEALLEMLQKYKDAVEEAEKALQEFKSQVDAPLLNSIPVDNPNTGDVWQRILSICSWRSNNKLIDIPLISESMNNVFIKMREREKINRVLARIDAISEDIDYYLEMLRKQRKKRNRRQRYRPYILDALGYLGVQLWPMRLLVL